MTWSRKSDGDGFYLELDGDHAVTVRISDSGDGIYVCDDEHYYPSGSYSIPFADLDWLRAESKTL